MTPIVTLVESWCTLQLGATVDNTFGDDTNVHRVGSKIFAMVRTTGDGFVTLKAPPEEAIALRESHPDVRPGYYMDKRHWITVDLPSSVTNDELRELVQQSYAIVAASLSAKLRAELGVTASKVDHEAFLRSPERVDSFWTDAESWGEP
jgi:predicted DNA-binding protein (MmcQ/YjbR family)